MQNVPVLETTHLRRIIELSTEVASYFHGSKRTTENLFVLSIIDRTQLSLRSIVTLLESPLSTVDFGLGLILRAQALDSLILLKAYQRLPNIGADMKSFHEYCGQILSEGFARSITFINDEAPAKEQSSLYTNLVAMNPSFFESYDGKGKPTILKKYDTQKWSTASKIYKNLKQSDEHKTDAKNLYDIYQYYSKYDHLGQLFYEFTRQPLTKRAKKLHEALTYIPEMYLYAISILLVLNPDDFMKQHFNLAADIVQRKAA